jgi:hypothetical protein
MYFCGVGDASDAARYVALYRLATEVQAVKAVEALRGAGVASLLLKGISHERWLYPDRDRPLSRDVDLLVASNRFTVACEAIASLGMRPDYDPLGPGRNGLDVKLVPTDRLGIPVELHTSFHFLTAPADRCWVLLSADSERIEVGRTPIDVPSVPARALLLSLHVVAHGSAGAWVIEDLRRALGALPLDAWRTAATLADELGASDAFSAGLRVLPAGAEIADALGLPEPEDPALLLSLQNASLPARRMVEYAHGHPLAALARVLRSQLIPPSDQMRTWYPMARRGWRGLAAAHAARLSRLARETPQLVADWRQAREVERR